MPITKRLLVSVINWNNSEATEKCLAGIAKIPAGDQPDVYLTDNNSLKQKFSFDPDSANKLNSLKTTYNSVNKGFAGGHNDAIAYAIDNNYDYVCLLNNDTEIIDRQVFDKLLVALEENQGAIGASPTILYTTEPPVIWFGGGTMNLAKADVHHNNVDALHDTTPNKDVENVTFLTGCCLMISLGDKSVDVRLDEDYFLYWEDADWCAKMLSMDKKLLYVPSALLVHEVSSSFGIRSAKYGYYNVRNALLFAKRWSPSKTIFLTCLWKSFKILGLSLKNPTKTPAVGLYLLRALKDGLTGKIGPVT